MGPPPPSRHSHELPPHGTVPAGLQARGGGGMATTIRLAFALDGTVSLAIWIGGVADDATRVVEGGRPAADGTRRYP